jgi:hemerythrin-like domain-containing protein
MRALAIIRDEHRALASVMKGLEYLTDQFRQGLLEPDFVLLGALVQYIEQYPDKLHHPKEDGYLFPTLRERDPSSAATLDQLEEQHRQGPAVISSVRDALAQFEANRSALPALAAAVTGYAQFQWDHMRMEEEQILPLAQKALLPADWVRIDAAFVANDDPLVGTGQQQEFRELFRRVVTLMPAPMGLGPAGGRP